jgi:hypothetical protein
MKKMETDFFDHYKLSNFTQKLDIPTEYGVCSTLVDMLEDRATVHRNIYSITCGNNNMIDYDKNTVVFNGDPFQMWCISRDKWEFATWIALKHIEHLGVKKTKLIISDYHMRERLINNRASTAQTYIAKNRSMLWVDLHIKGFEIEVTYIQRVSRRAQSQMSEKDKIIYNLMHYE